VVVKLALISAVVACLIGLAAPNSRAEEYYIYKSPHGRLVISNKPPPAGSDVLRKLELPETPDAEAQSGQESGNAQQDAPKPPKTETP
jgi:hypothetical protein